MNRYQFEIMAYLEKNGNKDYTMRSLSDNLQISGNMITKCLEELEK